ncbi:MAG: sensor histidine kinase [Paenibacillus sp.]|jgi:two-component system sensor histidine kinase YesM|nr:sensor histidine kinase [Paenibacillus sp.]
MILLYFTRIGRVPFILSMPGTLPSGEQRNFAVWTDIPATILAAADRFAGIGASTNRRGAGRSPHQTLYVGDERVRCREAHRGESREHRQAIWLGTRVSPPTVGSLAVFVIPSSSGSRYNRCYRDRGGLALKSIQMKMFIAFGLAVCLSIIPIAYSSYYNSSKVIERNAVSYISDRIRGANDNLQAMMEEADKISKVIVSNHDLVQAGLLSATAAPSFEWFREKKAVEEFLSSMAAYKNYVRQISVTGMDGKAFQTGGRRGNPDHIAELMRNPEMTENRKHLLFDPTGNGRLMMVRPILQGSQMIGICIVDFDPDIVKQVYDIEPLSGSLVSVIDDRNKMVYQSNSNNKQMSVEDTELSGLIDQMLPGEFHSKLVQIDKKSYLSVQSLSAYTGWTTVGMVPLPSLLRELNDIRYQTVSIAAAVLVAVLLLSILLSNQITKNIKRLSNTMKLVREGHMNARPRIRSNDEVGQLSDMFVSMMDRIQELLTEVKTRERQRREAEYRALQAQIKPHFLYNTLNIIKYLAHIQHARNIEEVSGSLIEMLRYTIDPKREMIAIREELEQVHSYIRIQKYKLLERVEVTVHTEEEVLDCLIPKLILQPIVENALNHGLSETDREGTVTVRIYEDGAGCIKMNVTDNGTGIPEERMKTILSDEDGMEHETRSGIGLRNIKERIRHTFGDSYGMSIYSQPNVFTTVEITVPQLRKEMLGDVESG